jgi:hypothetical protein
MSSIYDITITLTKLTTILVIERWPAIVIKLTISQVREDSNCMHAIVTGVRDSSNTNLSKSDFSMSNFYTPSFFACSINFCLGIVLPSLEIEFIVLLHSITSVSLKVALSS